MNFSNRTILFFIIIVGAILRFYNYFEIPFTHDELSALSRLHFDNFYELIEKGVKVEGHPAGIQVFLYYWTKLFGYSEWVVKLPFTLFGILSVVLIYKIAKEWYNESVGLISASFLASLQFTIMYSQIARPYISGLFFVLLMVYYWTKIIRTPENQFYRNGILFIISAALCAYNHHFSLLFAAIVGISGLFMIQRQYLMKYTLGGVIIFLLYLPHIGIFFHQLNYVGIEWLGEIHNDFIIDYIGYIFHFSTITYILVLGLVVFGFFKMKRKDVSFKKLMLFGTWFLLPFLIGFFYSKSVSSILQYSLLIFSFPFLFFILFGHIKNQKPVINLVIVATIFIINIFVIIYERDHYHLFYKSKYEQLLVDHQKVINEHDNVLSIIDSNKERIRYYYSKLNVDTNFVWFDSFEGEQGLIRYLEEHSQSSNYLYFGGYSSNNPLTVPIIQDYFPTIEWQHNYAGSTSYLFSKKENKENNLVDLLSFDSKHNDKWSSIDESKLIDTLSFSGGVSYLMDNQTEYSPSYTAALEDIILNENNFIDISVKAYMADKYDDIMLVATLEANGENIYWNGTSFDKFVTDNNTSNKWISIHHSIKLSDIYQKHDDIQLKVYVWNKNKQNFLLDDFKIILRQGNLVIYGLNEKI